MPAGCLVAASTIVDPVENGRIGPIRHGMAGTTRTVGMAIRGIVAFQTLFPANFNMLKNNRRPILGGMAIGAHHIGMLLGFIVHMA